MLYGRYTQRMRPETHPIVGLTRLAAAIVICKGCSARRFLHIVALSSGFEERTTVHGGGEKQGRNEDEYRLHG